MKKTYLAVLAVAAVGLAASGTAFAVGDGEGIAGSPHDFTDGLVLDEAGDESWNWRGEICRTCHAPHDKQRTAYQEGLLWNRQLSDAVYEPYVLKNGETTGQPTGASKMCLSCHDNTVALQEFDSYSPADNPAPNQGTFFDLYADDHFIVGMVDLEGAGTASLAGTHPISVSYDAGATRTQLHDKTSEMGVHGSGSIENVLQNSDLVQCSSCHDVHNRVSVPGTRLLRVAQTEGQGGTASGLCLTCHDK